MGMYFDPIYTIQENKLMKYFWWFLSILGIAFLAESILYGLDMNAAIKAIEEVENMGVITNESVQIFRIWLGFIIRILLAISFLGFGIHFETLSKKQEKLVEMKSTEDQLQELKEMLDDGLITQEDFEQKKKQILGL